MVLFAGLMFPVKITLPIEEIKSIQVTMFDPSQDFNSPLGIATGKNKWKKWIGLFAAFNNNGITIESENQNILLVCENPVDLSLKLKTVLNGTDIT
jgi:predicted Rossmann-fold nucleotide-binding protein